MKKFLLFAAILLTAITLRATELPEPTVTVLPNTYDWFDGFGVKWAEKFNQPYTLQIVNKKGISVTKNLVEDVDILDISLTEYQEDEDTPNYPNSQLVITLAMIEADINATYTLTIPAGAINVSVPGGETLPCEKVNYSFQLKAGAVAELPDPVFDPVPGVVPALSVVKMSWPGALEGQLDLLNVQSLVDENVAPTEITMTCNGEAAPNPEVSFEWSSRLAITSGSAGDILVLTLTDQESLPAGTYIINIPAGYLQISDIETGTLYNDDIEFTYIVAEDAGIDGIEADKADSQIYNLQGVKVDNPTKGIYIINGKKVAVK